MREHKEAEAGSGGWLHVCFRKTLTVLQHCQVFITSNLFRAPNPRPSPPPPSDALTATGALRYSSCTAGPVNLSARGLCVCVCVCTRDVPAPAMTTDEPSQPQEQRFGCQTECRLAVGLQVPFTICQERLKKKKKSEADISGVESGTYHK